MDSIFRSERVARCLLIGAIVCTSAAAPGSVVRAEEPLPYPEGTPPTDATTANSVSALAIDPPAHDRFEPGDVFVAAGNGQILWFLPDGTLNETLSTGTADVLTGMAFDAAGNLHVTAWSAGRIFKFARDGSLVGTFGAGYDCWPESITFDGSGSAYVGQAQCTKDLLKFDGSGQLQRSYDVPVPQQANFVTRADDECTLYYTSQGTVVRRVDLCTGEVLPDWATIPVPACGD